LSSLAQTLGDPKGLIAKVRVKAPALRELPRAVRAIQGELEGRLETEAIADLQERLGAEVGLGKANALTKRDLRRAPEAFFVAPHPLGRAPEIRGALLEEIERRGQWPDFAAALLLPWASQNPPDEHRELISDTLIAHAGDPRTTRRQVRWEAVKEHQREAFDLFLAWLTRASVLQFLDVVGEVARDDHWRYRRAFWVSYLEAGHIGCAWVAFGANAAPLARRMQAGLAKQSADAPFGEIERGTGKGPDWSALIMQIGDLVIADWSHSGKYNVWRRNSSGKPRFFQRRYYADELDSAPYRDSHIGSDRYYWQSKLADLIANETGLRTNRSAWRPGRT
jgi:hypothetical protein